MTVARLSGIAAIVAAGAVLFAFDPATTAWFPGCPFRAVTGWNCPGCGSLRALHALLHLDLVAALRANPMTTAVVLGGPPVALCRVLGVGGDIWPRLTTPATMTRAILAVCAFGVARNLPVWPFVWLIQ
jgi:hypothetical protein